MGKITSELDLQQIQEQVKPALDLRADGTFNKETPAWVVRVCMESSCLGSGAGNVLKEFNRLIEAYNGNGCLKLLTSVGTGCHGLCEIGPSVIINPGNTLYAKVKPEDVEEIFTSHLLNGEVVERLLYRDPVTGESSCSYEETDFFKHQTRHVLKKNALMDPWDIKDYIGLGGYAALARALTQMTPEQVLETVKEAGIRGRGGAGFPTASKWGFVRAADSDVKYVVCNGDEGDPGAYMDRSVLEGNPHSVIEGMVLGAYAIGNVSQGYAYIRAEYPLAIEKLTNAIKQAKEMGLLGENILGTGMNFDIDIFPGAGAFVCGEETALLRSIEGKKGRPRQRPPFPANVGGGLFGKPTTINNVETWSNIPEIVLKGGYCFSQLGTEKARGTKTFSLVGKINNTGLVEVPMGTTIGSIIFDIGGGIPNGKAFKAVQMGGPSGGVISAAHLNTPVDYESMVELGAIVGSGGMVVMDEDSCMVDVARYFLEFTREESCGKCVPCREGIPQMLDILNKISNGQAELKDLDRLEELATTIKASALCGLGQTAPNPVLSTLRHFRHEYEQHILEKKCVAGVCRGLFSSPCQHTCPVELNIPGYISLIKDGQFVEAYKLIKQRNPLPAICGRVCHHPCELKCNRARQDDALMIRDLKRFAADYAHNVNAEVDIRPRAGKNERVAIVGAGPAGLAAAWDLALEGYKVDIFEAQPVAGGMLAIAIPEYRLPKAILQREINEITRLGVSIMTNTPVDDPAALLNKGYQAVFIATGAHKGMKAGIPGEDLNGIYDAIEFLRRVNLDQDVSVGKRVAVIGGGNSAIDSARVALRKGAQEVHIIYRRTEKDMPAEIEEIMDAKEEGMALPAEAEEIRDAKEEGIYIHALSIPMEIIGDGGKVKTIRCSNMELREFDSSGRKVAYPIEGSTFDIDVDTVIEAIGQQPQTDFAAADNLEANRNGTLVVNAATLSTRVPGIFAGGDVVTGPKTVIECIAAGQKAAASIAKYLQGLAPASPHTRNEGNAITYPMTLPTDEDLKETMRTPVNKIPAGVRNRTFVEVAMTMNPEEAITEASRCLRCDVDL